MKPFHCPFCGSQRLDDTCGNDYSWWVRCSQRLDDTCGDDYSWWVRCDVCEAEGPPADTKEGAMELWQLRLAEPLDDDE